MRTVERQEKMIQQARDNPWSIAQVILHSDLRIDDQEDLLCIIQSNNNTDAFELYERLDAIIRDRFMDMIEDTLGSQRDSDVQNGAEYSFTPDELKMISDAIKRAVQDNYKAMGLTTSTVAQKEIGEDINRLTELEHKLYHILKEENRD